MDLISSLVEQYALKYTSPEDPVLVELDQFTRSYHAEHHMLSGALQGKFLEMVSHMIRPRRILEIGTFTGYSALCLVKGLLSDGHLHTIEKREEEAVVARRFFAKAGKEDQITLHVGDAKTIIPTLKEDWDLVFIDADKPGYIEYFNLIFPQLRTNGFILADNIFFHGQVLEEEVKGKNAKAIQAFNEFINEQTGIDKTILTLRDGLFLIRKC
ncbi:MAG: O-methyltransferase [Chitinophagaceae bacterium]|nr:O-methyltransferase [Chitinophagaceae bacterium]